MELYTLGLISKAGMGVIGIENVKRYLKKLRVKKAFFFWQRMLMKEQGKRLYS